MAAGEVTHADRLGFTVFLALVFHAVVILGVGFAPEDPQPSARSLDVTLATQPSDEAPDEADFVAEADQAGSGTEEEVAELTATQPPQVPEREIRETEPLPEEPAEPEPQPEPAQDEVVTTEREGDQEVPQEQRETPVEQETDPGERRSLMDRSREIASLQARLSDQRNHYAKRPRVSRVSSVSAMASANAAYVRQWQEHIERVGNLNYPEEARRRGLHGEVRMMVAINSDGSVREIEVRQSSGHTVLDDAARRIVRQASPYEAFTEDMKEEQDVLEIIRTWSFQPRGLTGGSG